MEDLPGIAGSIRFDARELDHLAPLLGFLSDELAEVGRRARKCGGAPLGKPRLHLGIGKGRVDLRVELVDDLGRRVARRADAGPEAKLIARREFGNRREVRKHRRASGVQLALSGMPSATILNNVATAPVVAR